MISKLIQSLAFAAICIIITASYSLSDNAPTRIVSLSPNLTQVIYALGDLDRVVGVTVYDEFPPEVTELPKIGGWINPNYEAIVELKPDVVVLMKDQDISFGDNLRSLGLKTFIAKSNDSGTGHRRDLGGMRPRGSRFRKRTLPGSHPPGGREVRGGYRRPCL